MESVAVTLALFVKVPFSACAGVNGPYTPVHVIEFAGVSVVDGQTTLLISGSLTSIFSRGSLPEFVTKKENGIDSPVVKSVRGVPPFAE